MRSHRSAGKRGVIGLIGLLLLAGCGGASQPPAPEAASPHVNLVPLDADALDAAGAWTTHGRTLEEQRYSPLDQINAQNVALMQRRWVFEAGTRRGLEATPLMLDGTLYLTLTWSVVVALDARTGVERWRHDPLVPREVGRKACCDVVNRGVAHADGRIFAGTLDGRLIALDAQTGELIWEVVTVDQSLNYTITGAPRIVDGRIIIGNGGAEYGVRGYVSAYSPTDGKQLWRTFIVPGNPADGFESEALKRAAGTWTGEWWKVGGGGTVWDSIAYDADLDLLYVGTGNGSPWTRHNRSPGGGDNLYLSSILALDPESGEIVWHYQTTPGETWDFTATQHMVLADLEIDGRTRKVLMQAPKNGFFYVIDRTNGEFISAEPYVTVSWASGIDENGRPIEVPGQRFEEGLQFVQPTFFGGHNWQPMSFSPTTGLVYIPAQEIIGAYRRDAQFEVQDHEFNLGTDPSVFAAFAAEAASGHLLAWDPVAQREAWRVPYGQPWNGGTLATAGNLVFQGSADGRFIAYRADDGRTLFVDHTETGVIAAPMTYALDGVQYVSILAGWGGAFALVAGPAARGAQNGPGRLITYALPTAMPDPAEVSAYLDRPGELADGERLYHRWCSRCHGSVGVSTTGVPDLRATVTRIGKDVEAITQGGLQGTGMPAMGDVLSAEDAELIRRYLQDRAGGVAPR